MGRKKAKKNKQRPRKKAGRVRLSLCLIARDEADFLGRCLESVKGLVDEIVVVDTGSEDQTVEVARQRGAQVFDQAWQGDFSLARNRSLEEARGEWILVLDCDEVLARKDHGRLLALLEEGQAQAYRMTTRNYCAESNRAGWMACCGEYAEEKHYQGWFPSTKVRLWRNRREIRFAGAVHELVEPAILRAGGSIGDCLVPVHHYGYVEKARRPDQYLEAGEQKVRNQPQDLRARYELAIAYRNAGRLGQALEQIERVIADLSRPSSQLERLYLEEELALLVRADVLGRLGKQQEALAAYQEILKAFPRSYQALNNQGLILERLGRLDQARECYARGAELAPHQPILAQNLARLQPALAKGAHTLSLCLIARDEERVIGRCLESAREVADQIVVVDTGSQDQTAEIARQHGAEIGHFAWCDDFAAARNASLEMARGEWVLWLDADEYLLPADRDKVKRAKGLEPNQALYFTLVNEGADRSRFRQVKMFPNRQRIRFERPVHETVVEALRRAGIPIRATDVEVRHTGYAAPETTARKRGYYLGLMQTWLAGHPEDWQTWFRVGHTFYTEGERAQARQYFARVLEAGERVEPLSVRRLAAAFSGRCLLEEGQYEGAIQWLEQARQMQPDDALVLVSLGDACAKVGRYQQALGFLRAAEKGRMDTHFPLDERLIRYSLYFFLGQVCQELGRRVEAEAALAQAAQVLPERPEAAQALARLREGTPRDSGLHLRPARVQVEGEAPRRHTLSLCLIARNEEERLGRCLDSVKGLVDEIVVVDTGSEDQTVEVARKHGARIGHFAWCDDFAAARNVSLRLAKGDWIMWLDADDLLPAECHAKVRHLLELGKDKSYFFVLDDQGYENVSCLQMRLFPNLPGVEFEMPIHEQVTPSLARLGVEMLPTDVRVVHTGYATPQIVRAKKDRYLRIMEAWLEQHPENYIVRSHVALTYHTTGRLDEAERAYRRIIEESTCYEDHNWVVYTTALLFLGRTYLKKGELEKARQYMAQAEKMDPEYVLTRLSLAEVHARLKEWDTALRYGRGVLEGGGQMTFFPIDQRELRYSAHVLCGQAHQALGNMAQAEAAFRSAAAVPVPRRSEALGNLSNLYKAQGERHKARQALEEARRLDPENARHLFNLGVMHLEEKDLDQAGDFFRRTLEKDPGFALALLNLGYLAKTRGKLEEAERLYQQAMESDPEGVEARANLGHLYLDQERFAEAEEMFAQVRERQKGLLDIDLGLLVARAQGKDGAQTGRVLGEVMDSFPHLPRELRSPAEQARTLVQLGAALVKANLPRCAELAFRAAVLLDGQLGEARRGLGEIFFAQGAYWKAIPQYEALLLAQPQNSAAFRRLGDCYDKLGVREAAQMCYAQSQKVQGT